LHFLAQFLISCLLVNRVGYVRIKDSVPHAKKASKVSNILKMMPIMISLLR